MLRTTTVSPSRTKPSRSASNCGRCMRLPDAFVGEHRVRLHVFELRVRILIET